MKRRLTRTVADATFRMNRQDDNAAAAARGTAFITGAAGGTGRSSA
jgi:hypothetical protein